jgi:hypothetical protein
LASVAFFARVNTLPLAETVRVVEPTIFPDFFMADLTVLPLIRFSDRAS